MNFSNASALAFALFIASLLISGAAEAASRRHSDQRHPHLHKRVQMAPASGPTQPSSQGAQTLPRSPTRPLVTNDSDGLSRDPEDCNKGCLGNSE